jgi:hypothetical protein
MLCETVLKTSLSRKKCTFTHGKPATAIKQKPVLQYMVSFFTFRIHWNISETSVTDLSKCMLYILMVSNTVYLDGEQHRTTVSNRETYKGKSENKVPYFIATK